MALKISIITPSLNHGEWIEKTIQSILDQRYADFEHIVIDGGSTDRTLDVLKKYPHLFWISEKDSGRTQAINKGFKRAKGEILAWLSADDYFLPGTFDKVAGYFAKDPGDDVLIGRAKVVDRAGDFLFDQEEPADAGFTHKGIVRFWKYAMLPQPSLFFRRRVLDSLGYLDESLKAYMDYDFMLRLSERYAIRRVPDFFSCIRFHDRSDSVADLASGRLNRLLLPISKKYWGRPGTLGYCENLISFILYWPLCQWRAHYERFVFAVRKALSLKPREYPTQKSLWKAKWIFVRYPLPFLVAAIKQAARSLGVFKRGGRGS